jgi:hypothetical protein
MGSAIECFDDADAVVVPRSRFAPVKTCNDLFGLRSGQGPGRHLVLVLRCTECRQLGACATCTSSALRRLRGCSFCGSTCAPGFAGLCRFGLSASLGIDAISLQLTCTCLSCTCIPCRRLQGD